MVDQPFPPSNLESGSKENAPSTTIELAPVLRTLIPIPDDEDDLCAELFSDQMDVVSCSFLAQHAKRGRAHRGRLYPAKFRGQR